jgi:hypothetical protein
MDNLIESNISSAVDKMFGDKDSKLKTIAKIDLMNEGKAGDINEDDKRVLSEIKRINQLEQYYVESQLHFTLDNSGNLVEIQKD